MSRVMSSCTLDNVVYRVEAGIIYRTGGIMRQVVLWDTACNFNAVISNQSIFNCLITSASTVHVNII